VLRVLDVVFTGACIRLLKTPSQAPRPNAFVERWIGTVCRECVDRLLIVSQRHLLKVLGEYVTHYNARRPNRSLPQASPLPNHLPPTAVS
jgi:putative transposase